MVLAWRDVLEVWNPNQVLRHHGAAKHEVKWEDDSQFAVFFCFESLSDLDREMLKP